MSQQDMFGSLEAAKSELWQAMKRDGMDCPCCGRFAKLYKYTISSAQINAFRWLVNASGDGLVFVRVQENAPKWLLRSNSHGKLAHWGLLESKWSDDESKHMSGVWRPTIKGTEFFNGLITIQKYALVFDNQCLGHGGPRVSFRDLFDEFHYGELMSRQAADDAEENRL